MGHFLFTKILCVLLLSTKFIILSFGVDTLLSNQKISVGDTLFSSNEDFEMGFFSPGKSRNWFLGIWYKRTPDVRVWVANRNHPITDTQGVTFAISGNGNLAIRRYGSVIWSANSSEVASDPVLQLLDTGNLVLVDKAIESLSREYLWQSFDYPMDSILPGMEFGNDVDTGVATYVTSWKSSDDPSPGDLVLKFENRGLPEVVMYRRNVKIFRTGIWNGAYFGGVLPFPHPLFKPHLVFNEGRMTAIVEPYDSSNLARSTLDSSGLLLRYVMNTRKDKWNLAYSVPRDACDEYGMCGPNGVCTSDNPVRCDCLKGFTPKFPKEWDLLGWSGGCTRIVPLNCKNGDGFLEVRRVKYPDMLTVWLNMSMSLVECKAECLKNCNCSAYANPYVTNGGSGCLLWFGDLIDIRDHPTGNSKQNVYIRLPASELLNYSMADLEKEKKKRPARLILMSIVSGGLVSGFINGAIFMMSRRKLRAIEKNNEDMELPSFKFATIMAATNNFSRENKIGEGGFGPVYKGKLSAEEEIAVKRLSRTSGQGPEEFKNEVNSIAKLQHTNLVRLLGCCIQGEEKILIYEYLQNKSLDLFIFDQNQKTLLTWPKRFDIIMGIARGLLYLHHDSRLKIIHRDLKTSNILLDKNFNPKISDFGLARAFGEDQPVAKTKRVVGTYGYMAPEYAIAGKFSVKSDVFSMGVVLLEVVSGKKNRGLEYKGDHYLSLLGHAWLLWKENRILDLMDDSLSDTFIESQVNRCIQVGLLCVQKDAEDRPEMSSVIFMLGTDGAALPEPKEPGFFFERNCTSPEPKSETSPGLQSERNTITITDLEAR